MMKKLLLFVLLSCSTFLFSQNKIEILNKIKNHTKQDSVRVELLVDACVSGTFDSDKELLKYAQEALDISNKTNYGLGKIRAVNCIGNYYFQRGDFKKSINLYFEALKLSEKRKDTNNIIISKSNIANVYTRTQNHQKAIELLKECDAIFLEKKETESEHRAAILTNLATVYSNINQHELSIKTYNTVYSISTKIKSLFGQAITLANLGNEYYKINKIDKALDLSLKALDMIEKNNIDFLKTEIYKILGSIYAAKKDYSRTEFYLKKAETLSKQIEDNETLIEVYGNLKSNYFNSGDFKKAYLASEEYINLREKIFSIETKKNTDELSTKYETEKKESQIKQLTQQKQITELKSQQKSIILYSSLIGFVGVLLSFYFFFRRFKTNKQNEILKEQLTTINAQKRANESELKALKSQMNPHFIFNALNSIQEQFMYGDKIIANEQMNNFTQLTRQILETSGKRLITIENEIEFLTKYLELEKMRFNNDFEYSITTSKNIDEEYHKIPPMLIQPFVENSIKHGLLHKSGIKALNILFDLDEKGEYIICTIDDNGIGREASEKINQKNRASHNSFSTHSISNELKIINNNQVEDFVIYEDLINDKGSSLGTKVVLKIKLI